MVTTGERKPWHAIFRLLERDERVFAVLLAVAMVGGLATLGLVPAPAPPADRPLLAGPLVRRSTRSGIFALVTVYPARTRAIFIGALGIDLLLVSCCMYLTGGGDSLFYTCSSRWWRSTPTTSVRGWGCAAALVAGGLYAAAAALAPPCAGWTAVSILAALFGIPAVAARASWPSVSGGRAARSSGSTPR